MLLALSEGKPLSLMDSPHKGPVMQCFDVSFGVSLNNLNEETGETRVDFLGVNFDVLQQI